MRFKLILFCIILFPFVYTLNSQTNNCKTPECYNEMISPCSCYVYSDWAESYELVVLDKFPLCTLEVKVCYRQCLDGPNGPEEARKCVQMYVKGISILYNCLPNCTDFIDYIFAEGDTYLQARRSRYIINHCIEAVAKIWFGEFVQDCLDDGISYGPCDDPTQTRYKVHAFLGKCYAFCYTKKPIENPDVELLITPINCTNNYCCIRTIELCYDEATGQVRSTVSMTTTGDPPCYSAEIPSISNCPPGFETTVTGCIESCYDDDEP